MPTHGACLYPNVWSWPVKLNLIFKSQSPRIFFFFWKTCPPANLCNYYSISRSGCISAQWIKPWTYRPSYYSYQISHWIITEFNWGMVVRARWAGLSISDTSDLGSMHNILWSLHRMVWKQTKSKHLGHPNWVSLCPWWP